VSAMSLMVVIGLPFSFPRAAGEPAGRIRVVLNGFSSHMRIPRQCAARGRRRPAGDSEAVTAAEPTSQARQDSGHGFASTSGKRERLVTVHTLVSTLRGREFGCGSMLPASVPISSSVSRGADTSGGSTCRTPHTLLPFSRDAGGVHVKLIDLASPDVARAAYT